MRSTLFALSLLGGCAAPDADALPTQRPPPTSELRLAVDALVPGQPATWFVDGLAPGERVHVVRGVAVGPGSCPPVAGGLCLDVTGTPTVLTSGVANAAGTATLTLTVPPTVPVGYGVAFQAVALAGASRPDAAKSNPVRRSVRATPPDDVSVAALVITEIMADPAAVADAAGEWFELRNAGADTVDLEGLRIADAGGGVIVDRPVVVEPGEHVVIARQNDPAANGGVWPAWSWRSTFSLANGSDSLRLEDGPRLIDAVTWTSSIPGVSRSLDPSADALDNDAPGVWCEGDAPFGAGDLGSPGAPNGSCGLGVCGDALVQPGEACDLGALNGVQGAACAADCTSAALAFSPLAPQLVPTLAAAPNTGNPQLVLARHDNDAHADAWLAWRDEVIAVEGVGDGTFYAPPVMDCGLATVPGDLDGDGLTDLAGVDDATGRLVICWNNGGSWTRALQTHPPPVPPTTADVDGDGDADVLWADPTNSAVQVVYGGASRVLPSPVAHATLGPFGGASPRDVLTADLNGDGLLDLASRHTGAVVVQEGLGGGAFAAPYAVDVAWAGATGPNHIRAVDVDDDGDLDLLATLSNATVWAARTPAGFATRALAATHGTMHQVAVGDVTGDGVTDLVSDESGTLRLYRGVAGPGTFAVPVTLPTPFGAPGAGYGITLADLDDDGDLDVLVEGRASPIASGRSIAHLRNDGAGGFTVVGHAGVLDGGARGTAPRPVVLDVDGDGALDVYADGPMLVDASGELRPAPRLDLGSPHDTWLADLSGDGLPDTTSDYGGDWYETLPLRVLDPSPHLNVSTDLHLMAVADVTRDGHPDLISVTRWGIDTQIRVGVGDGGVRVTYPDPPEAGMARDGAIGQVAVVDVSGDGRPDLLLTDTSSGQLRVGLGDANRRFPTRTSYAIGATAHQLLVADVTGDGHLDAIVVCRDDDALRVLPGLGGGAFGPARVVQPLSSPLDLNHETRVIAADFDGDGLTDLAVSSPDDGVVAVLRAFGGGVFGEGQALTPPATPAALAADDVDGDGRMDLVLALFGPLLQTWRGQP